MIQRQYFELKKAGDWILYRIDYYYQNKPCYYYELHKSDIKDGFLRFGERKFNALKKMLTELVIK